MAQIGTFTRDATGIFTGEVRTLTHRVAVTIKPCPRENDKAPDHRIETDGYVFGLFGFEC